MRYRDFIEEVFIIDSPEGKLVPFVFRPIQNKYYNILQNDYDIEKNGTMVALREDILKARKEGFSSEIQGIFAADDIFCKYPGETAMLSYIDDSTAIFRKRYRLFILSWVGYQKGYKREQLIENPNLLWSFSREAFFIDNGPDATLRHNRVHFTCGTASTKTGKRGGTVQKLWFSEHHHFPDTDKITAKEILTGTSEQVPVESGWIFRESTGRGFGSLTCKEFFKAYEGRSRYKGRFFSRNDFYTPQQLELIRSQSTDEETFNQEYPNTPEEAFIYSGNPYFNNKRIAVLMKKVKLPIFTGNIKQKSPDPNFWNHYPIYLTKENIEFYEDSKGSIKIWEWPNPYSYYVIGGDVAEGLAHGDNSVLRVIDNVTGKTVAKFKGKVKPDELAHIAFMLGVFYNYAYEAIEVNKDGLWVNTELIKLGYPNVYFQEIDDEVTKRKTKKYGWRTDAGSRPTILAELQKLLASNDEWWFDKEFLDEALTFVRNSDGRPEAMSECNDDDIMTTAIVYTARHDCPMYVMEPPKKAVSDNTIIWENVEKDINNLTAPKDESWDEG